MRWPVCRTTGAGPKPKERLSETFEGRLDKHTGIVHERLLAEADAKVGAQLLLPGHDPPSFRSQPKTSDEPMGDSDLSEF
jgi:hypothetical protein